MWPSQTFLDGVSSVLQTVELAIRGNWTRPQNTRVVLLSEDPPALRQEGGAVPGGSRQFAGRLARMS